MAGEDFIYVVLLRKKLDRENQGIQSPDSRRWRDCDGSTNRFRSTPTPPSALIQTARSALTLRLRLLPAFGRSAQQLKNSAKALLVGTTFAHPCQTSGAVHSTVIERAWREEKNSVLSHPKSSEMIPTRLCSYYTDEFNKTVRKHCEKK